MPGDAVLADTHGHGFDDRGLMANDGWPKMAFIEHEFAGDPTNWWAPNAACVEAMLRSSGFAIIQHPEAEVYICRRAEPPFGPGAVYPARRPSSR